MPVRRSYRPGISPVRSGSSILALDRRGKSRGTSGAESSEDSTGEAENRNLQVAPRQVDNAFSSTSLIPRGRNATSSGVEECIAAVRLLLENNAGQMIGQLAERTSRLQADVLQQVHIVVDQLQREVARLQVENERLFAETTQLRKGTAKRSQLSPEMSRNQASSQRSPSSLALASDAAEVLVSEGDNIGSGRGYLSPNVAVDPSRATPSGSRSSSARSLSPPAPSAESCPPQPVGDASVLEVPGALTVESADEKDLSSDVRTLPRGFRRSVAHELLFPPAAQQRESDDDSEGDALHELVAVESMDSPSSAKKVIFKEGASFIEERRSANSVSGGDPSSFRMPRSPTDGLASDDRDRDKADRRKAPAAAVFADAAAMKDKIRQAVCKKEYRVSDYYHDTGIFQLVAKSPLFDNITLVVIAFNALWIAIDTDYNTADLLLNAEPQFIIAENAFCTYFSFEWFVRFGAFRIKRDAARDAWFCFDSALVLMMVLETWTLPYVLSVVVSDSDSSGEGLSNVSIVRLVRLARLTRMARMARILRAIPELIILIKGIWVAGRSVFFTLLLLLLIMYVFAVVFRQLIDQVADPGPALDSLKELYFGSVSQAMASLLLEGVLPDMAHFVRACNDQSWILGTLVLGFILLATLTVMNMLVGVLCEVVSVVSSVEKEQLTVNYVKAQLIRMFEDHGVDAQGEGGISKSEFDKLLVRPDAARIIQEIGVDVVGLVDFSDYVFRDGIQINFADFMELVLQLRGTNNATVKDIVDLRRYVLQELSSLQNKVCNMLTSIQYKTKTLSKDSDTGTGGGKRTSEGKNDTAVPSRQTSGTALAQRQTSGPRVAAVAPPAGIASFHPEDSLGATAARYLRLGARPCTNHEDVRPETARGSLLAAQRARLGRKLAGVDGLAARPWLRDPAVRNVLLQSMDDSDADWDYGFAADEAELAEQLELSLAMSKRKPAWRSMEDEV